MSIGPMIRGNLSIYKTGKFFVYVHGGAYNHVISIYSLSEDGTEAEELYNLSYDGWDGDKYFSDGTEISEAEYFDIMGKNSGMNYNKETENQDSDYHKEHLAELEWHDITE